MNCYNHNTNPAVGICKHCNKGICIDCTADSGDGIACHGKCLEEVKIINKLINHNKKVVKGTPSNWSSTGLFYIFLGAVFALFPLIFYKRFDPLITTLGILFVVFGVYTLLRARTYKEDPRDF